MSLPKIKPQGSGPIRLNVSRRELPRRSIPGAEFDQPVHQQTEARTEPNSFDENDPYDFQQEDSHAENPVENLFSQQADQQVQESPSHEPEIVQHNAAQFEYKLIPEEDRLDIISEVLVEEEGVAEAPVQKSEDAQFGDSSAF